MLKKSVFIRFLAGIVIFTACSKSNDTTPDNEDNNNNNNGNNPPNLSPGWYTDTVSFHATGTTATLVALQSDGKIIGANTTQIARLNKDGSLDQTFTPFKITTGEVHALCVDKNNRIYIGGSFTQFNGSNYSYLLRLTKEGTIDNSMPSLTTSGNNISGIAPDIRCLALRNDGKLMIGGTFSYNFFSADDDNHPVYSYDDIMRLNADGSVDNSLVKIKDYGLSRSHLVTHINILSDNKMYVTGKTLIIPVSATENITDVARLNADGSLDSTFKKTTGQLNYSNGNSIGLAHTPFTVKGLNDGTVLMGGDFTDIDGKSRIGLLHLSAQGIPDLNFTSTGAPIVTDICQFADNEIFLAEINPQTNYFGSPAAKLKLIQSDGKDPGTIKDAFILGGNIYSVIKESDSTILIAGQMITKINAYEPNTTVAFARIKKHL
jgi:uncharacterized delta-60 repeat protein